MEKRVAIIGAGVSGLLACKYTLSKGYHPILFEAKNDVGGVWTNTLESTSLQSPRILYQFSDFPWPSSVTNDFPKTQEVMEYLNSYAVHFDLFRHIRFNRKVVKLSYEGPEEEEMRAWSLWGGAGDPFASKGRWFLTVQDTRTNSAEDYQVDFVILCVGRFSDVPNIPEFPPGKGPEAFKGKVIHSMDYANMDNASAAEFVKAKRIAVVGNGKSGVDIANECAEANGVKYPCTVIFRKERWNTSRHLHMPVSLAYLYFNRFAELLVHKPEEGFLLGLLATILAPLRWGISKYVERYMAKQLKLDKHGMVPKHSFLQEVSACSASMLPDGYYEKVEEGSIKLVKAQKFSFCQEGILVDGKDEVLKTDLVILATGFRGVDKLKHIFVSPFFQNCIAGSDNQTTRLYRECIHPRVPQLAMIGFYESAATLYTSEMRCRWLAELLDGTFKLPTIDEMERRTAEWDKYMRKHWGKFHERSCIGALQIWYNDQLCKDMGWNPRRKKSLFSELFEPYGPWDYVQP